MKTMFRDALAEDQQIRKDQVAAIKQRKAVGELDSEEEQFELA